MRIGANGFGVLLSGLLLVFGTGSAQAKDCPHCNDPATAEDEKPKHEVLGPCDMPKRLEGRWKVSLCVFVKHGSTGHTWLRYENCQTHEVHTVGRYQKDHGGTKDPESGEWVYPAAPISGTIYDIDLKREKQIRAGEVRMLSCFVDNPIVFRGQNGGFGHGGVHDNCVTHARDGWCHFTGEYYGTGWLIESPQELLREVAKRHPEINAGR